MTWTPEMDDRIISGRRNGKSFTEIGRGIQVSRNAVASRWRKLSGTERSRVGSIRASSGYYRKPKDIYTEASKAIEQAYARELQRHAEKLESERKNLEAKTSLPALLCARLLIWLAKKVNSYG